MKTASKTTRAFGLSWAAFSVLGSFLFAPVVHAAEGTAPPLVVAAQNVAPVPAPPPSTAAAPAGAAPTLALPTTADAAPPALPTTATDEKGSKGLANAEDKLSDSVKGVVKHMSTTENVTLDDLNTARQAVAKIDALIDIEKRLVELDKLRNEREGKSLSAAIPASALMPSFPSPQPTMQPMMQQASFQPPMSTLDISRIVGSGGHYTAFVKGPDGLTKPIVVGDRLQGGKVIAITSTGVELEENGKHHTIPIKNVETVFGHSS